MSYCLKYWSEEIVFCTCGTCLIPTEFTRRLHRERFDELTIPDFVYQKGNTQRCSPRKNRYDSILHRFQQSETYRESQKKSDGTKKLTDVLTEFLHRYLGREAEVREYLETGL